MALTYPLGVDVFQSILGVQQVIFKPNNAIETSGLANGIVNVKEMRPTLWTAQVTTRPFLANEASAVQALLEVLSRGDKTFYLYNTTRKYPIDGNFDDSAVKIRSLGSDGTSLSLKSMPVGRSVKVGDMISYSYGAKPSRALHRICETATADGSGNTAEFQVFPELPASAVSNVAAQLVKAYGEFMMVGDFTPDNTQIYTQFFTFNALQV